MLTMKIDEPKGYLPEDIYNLAIMNVLVTVEEDCTILEESVVNRGKKKKIVLKYHSLKKKNPTLKMKALLS